MERTGGCPATHSRSPSVASSAHSSHHHSDHHSRHSSPHHHSHHSRSHSRGRSHSRHSSHHDRHHSRSHSADRHHSRSHSPQLSTRSKSAGISPSCQACMDDHKERTMGPQHDIMGASIDMMDHGYGGMDHFDF